MAQQSIPRRGRSYRSELRRAQAEQTRSRVVAAAAELFAELGYAGTTLAKVAKAAGVSAETVQAHGPKAALLIAAIEYAAFGAVGEEDILNLDVGRRLVAIDDRDESLDFLVAIQTDVHERTARLGAALTVGAAADAELDEYSRRLIAGVARQLRRVLEVYSERGWLRADVPFDELVETAVVIGSVETFSRITARDGWSVPAYRAWLRRMLAETVLRAD